MSWLGDVIERFHPSCKKARACLARATALYNENEELMRQADECGKAATCKCGKFATCQCEEAEKYGEPHDDQRQTVYHRA